MDAATAIDEIESVAGELQERVQDFSAPTCQWIDNVLREIKPVAQEADRLERLGHEASSTELIEFAADADTLLRQLPDLLEELRGMNDGLRTALHEALQSRKSAADSLSRIAGQIDILEDAQ